MRIFARKFYNKVYGGAVMFQVLLGLGLMVMMSPMIFTQIKKYNEEVQREEAVHDLEQWQRAASSFIVFEKDKPNVITEGITMTEGNSLFTLLQDYTGSSNVHTTNGFGQKYALITNRKGEQVEAVVVAYGGGLDTLTLNGIGQFLFDKGSIVNSSGQILTDMKVSPELKTKLTSLANAVNGGLLFMYVSDAFFSSDYLHIAEMPGTSERASLVNTMIVDLNMGGNNERHSINNINNINASQLTAGFGWIDLVSVSQLKLNGSVEVEKAFEYANVDGISGTELPVKTTLGADESESFRLDAEDDLTVENAELKKLYLRDSDLEVKGDMMASNYYIHGDVDIDSSSSYLNVNDMYVNTFFTDGNVADSVENIVLDKPEKTTVSGDYDKDIKNSFIYIGQYEDKGGEKVYSDTDYIMLDLAGTSEVEDICDLSGENCLSDKVLDFYDRLEERIIYVVGEGA